MHFFSRLFSRSAKATANRAASHSSATRAGRLSARCDDDPAPSAPAERAQRREQLYEVVREGMMHAGVLSSGYKFKVLALDPRGRQFLIMMDLADQALPEERWQGCESALTQAAQARFDITIKAVYWRLNHDLPNPLAAAAAQPARHAATRSRLTPLELPIGERPTQPAALESLTSRRGAAQRQDPLQPEEVAAFGKALAAARAPQAPPQPPSPSSSSSLRRRSDWRASALAGFEDTRIFPEAAADLVLGPTQYGELN